VKVDTSKFKPLTELGHDQYQAFPGGLYPDGKKRTARRPRSGRHGLRQKRCSRSTPTAKPSADGKVVLLSIGMSNTNAGILGV